LQDERRRRAGWQDAQKRLRDRGDLGMSLTVVVMARSVTVTKRFSISSGATPGKLQITLTTGMSILGKMSVAMRVIVTMPMSTIRMAITVKV